MFTKPKQMIDVWSHLLFAKIDVYQKIYDH